MMSLVQKDDRSCSYLLFKSIINAAKDSSVRIKMKELAPTENNPDSCNVIEFVIQSISNCFETIYNVGKKDDFTDFFLNQSCSFLNENYGHEPIVMERFSIKQGKDGEEPWLVRFIQ